MTQTEKDSLKGGGFLAWYLQSRTLALLILLIFLLILGVATYQGAQHYRNRLAQIRTANQTAANLLALFIGEHQKAMVDILRSYATRPLLVQAVKSRQPERAREHLISLAKENPEFATLFITDREGTLWASHPLRPEIIGRNSAYREWYKEVSGSGKSYVSGVFKRSVGEKDLAVSVCVPIRDEKGRAIHILAATQRLILLAEIIRRFPFEHHAHVTLIDQSGSMLYSDSYSYQPEPSRYPHLAAVAETRPNIDRKTASLTVPEGRDAGYLSAASAGDIGWTVIVETTGREILHEEYGYLLQAGVISLLTFLLIVTLLVSIRKDVGHRYVAGLLAARRDAEEKERRYLSLLESVRMIAVGLDPEGRITYANPFLLKLTGFTAQETQGQNWFAMFIPDGARPGAEEIFRRLLTDTSVSHDEQAILTKSGEERFIAWNHTALHDAQGFFAGTMSLGVDITLRRQTEALLKDSEERYRKAFAVSPDSININSLEDGMFVNINEGFTKRTGFTEEEVIGKTAQEANIWADMADRERLVAALKAVGQVDNLEAKFKMKDGTVRTGLMSAIVVSFKGTPHILSITRDIEEIRKTQDALRVSEEKYRTLHETMAQGVIYHDGEGHIVSMNPAAEMMLGLSIDQLQRRTSLVPRGRIIREDGTDFPGEDHPAMVALRTGKPVKNVVMGVFNPVRNDTVWLKIDATPQFRPGEEKPYQVYAMFDDITARTHAEKEERRSRELAEQLAGELTVIAEIGRLIGSTLDIDAVYERFAAEAKILIPFDRIVVNLNRYEDNVRYIAYVSGTDVPQIRKGDALPLMRSVNDVLAHNRTGFIFHPANVAEVAERYPTLDSTFEAGLRSMLSVPLISHDEVIGALHFRALKPNVYTEWDLRMAERIGAQIAGAIANAELFKNLRDTERSFRESEMRFRAIFEQAAVGVSEIDVTTGRYLTVNRRLCEIVGRTEEELLATSFLAITHPEDLHLHDDKTALLIAGTIRDYTLEKRYIRKDGKAIWVSITVSPLWKKGEAPGRNIAVVQDITEKKHAEEEIRKLNMELEQRVTERTTQLEAMNREMEAFSYSVSHDLRTPLRSIDGFSRALLEDYRDTLDETGKSYLERLLRATRTMSILIDAMLNLSRLTRTAMRSERVDLTEVARRITQSLRQSDPARSVDVVIQEGIVVWGDLPLLRVVMENLLANAWKFTGKNPQARIEFGITNGDGENCYYLKDNGVGFDMAYADKLFGAFQRLHRQDEFPGTGIGLATVQRIINRHGGRIWAESRTGEGAAFFFVLPTPP